MSLKPGWALQETGNKEETGASRDVNRASLFGRSIRVCAVCIPGEQVLNFKPDSAGCISLSMRPWERTEGEKMTGRFV